MLFIDTHCHLNFDPLANQTEAVLARARAAGVTRIIAPAFDLASWHSVVELGRHDGVYPALGLHPWRAEEELDSQVLEKALLASGAVAVGEIGLDSHVDVPMSRQLDVLHQQLEVAVSLTLPVLLHCRGAFEALLRALETVSGLAGVVHAFSKGPELAERFLGLGLYLAFGGAVTRERAKRARRAAKRIPRERLLLETDAPSIGLEGIPPEHTEPSHIPIIAESLATLRGDTLVSIADATTANARMLFRID